MQKSSNLTLKEFDEKYNRILQAKESPAFDFVSATVKDLVQNILDHIIDFEASAIYMPSHETFSSYVPNLHHESFLEIANLRNLIQGL